MQIVLDDSSFSLWPYCIGLLAVTALVIYLRKRDWAYILFFGIFWVYLLTVMDLTLFPLYIPSAFNSNTDLPYIFSLINFKPITFNAMPGFMSRLFVLQIFQNILLTIPFGFGIFFIRKVRMKTVLLLCFLPGLLIEGSQLLLSVVFGIQYRTVDLNDVILNTIGVLLGCLIFHVFSLIFTKFIDNFHLKPTGLFKYIHQVSTNHITGSSPSASTH